MTLTSLLLQPSTITCWDRLDRNCVNIGSIEPPIPTEQSLFRIPWWLIQSKAALKSINTILASSPFSNTLFSVSYTHKCIAGIQTFPISKLGGWKHTTASHKSSEVNRHLVLKHFRQYWCFGNWLVQLATEEDGGLFEIGMTLACLQQAGKLPRWTSRLNTKIRQGARTSAVLFRKRGNIPNGSESP